MAHFAKLGANGKVIQVLTMDNDKMLNADGVEDENSRSTVVRNTQQLACTNVDSNILQHCK